MSESTVRLGLMPPLTGLVAIYGQEIIWAARIACDEVNEQGGILGCPLELIIEDDGSLPDTAVLAAKRLLDQHRCVALIGNLLSNSRIAVVDQVAEPRQVPLLNFSFYEGSIRSHYFFHFAALPNQQIDKMIPFMARRYGPKMFFAGNNYEWPRGSIDAAKRALQRLDGDCVGEEYLDFGVSESEIGYLLEKVARSGANVFVPYFAGTDQIILLNTFSAQGLKERMAVVMGHYDEVMVSKLTPEVRAGFYSSNTYFMSLETSENRRVLQRLATQPGVTGIWPHGNGVMSNFGEGAYVCVHAFARAARNAGTLNTEALIAALERVTVSAPQGRVTMDLNTHHACVNTYLTRCRADGTFALIQSFGCEAPRIPERYLEPETTTTPAHEVAITPALSARLAAKINEVARGFETSQSILAIADVAVIATDANGMICTTNPRACQMFGYDEAELVGMSVHLLVPPHFRARHVEVLRQFVASNETERLMSARGEVMGYRKDGTFMPLQASIAKSLNAQGEWLLVVTLRDISEQKRQQEALLWHATHDALTGLANRDLIRDRLQAALRRSRRDSTDVAVVFIDLDGFKLINDTHGHEVGDRVLQKVAERLLVEVRPGDIVGRLASDEFVVLCEQVEQPVTISALAERLNETLREPIDDRGQRLQLSASIGVAIGSGYTHAPEDLLRYADTAMAAVKEKGRDGWQFFNKSLQDQARQRLEIIKGLHDAIERGEFSARFQPIVIAESGRIVGAELLLRWHPPQGEISPGLFIPVAESTGSIGKIGAWVFREACRAQVAWRQRWGVRAPYVAVNVSARQLSEPQLVEQFESDLRASGAQAEQILLEITETALMADIDSNLRVLRRLADLGLRVAVDDFGTGYSSLAQLTRLPAHVLKIDRAFVEGLGKSADNRVIVRTIIDLGRSLGLKLVAEGVEDEVQQRELCALGCHLLQGYHFYRPLLDEAFITAVETQLRNNALHGAPPLYFLIYTSRATLPMRDDELARLIEQAQTFNRAAGITGCLVYRDGYFMQMLEGKREVVLALMEKIKHDRRHSEVRVIIEGSAECRVFSDWGMSLLDATSQRYHPASEEWRRRTQLFLSQTEDARTCYAYMAAFMGWASLT